jgi:hypothetical protein
MTSSKPTGASRRRKKGNDGTGAAAQGPRVARDDSERCADQSKAGDDGLSARDEWRQADRAEPGERQVTRADQKAVFQELDPLQRILTPQPRQPAPFTEGDRSRAANADLVRRLELNDPDPAKLKEGKRAAELEGEHTSFASESSVVPAKPSSEVDYLADVKQALSEERYKNAAAKQRIRSLEASIRLGLYETIELKSRTARAEDKSAEHVAQLKVLERAIDLTEAQLNAVLASPSWRLTAPWRAYKRGLSGLSRAKKGSDRPFPIRQRSHCGERPPSRCCITRPNVHLKKRSPTQTASPLEKRTLDEALRLRSHAVRRILMHSSLAVTMESKWHGLAMPDERSF